MPRIADSPGQARAQASIGENPDPGSSEAAESLTTAAQQPLPLASLLNFVAFPEQSKGKRRFGILRAEVQPPPEKGGRERSGKSGAGRPRRWAWRSGTWTGESSGGDPSGRRRCWESNAPRARGDGAAEVRAPPPPAKVNAGVSSLLCDACALVSLLHGLLCTATRATCLGCQPADDAARCTLRSGTSRAKIHRGGFCPANAWPKGKASLQSSNAAGRRRFPCKPSRCLDCLRLLAASLAVASYVIFCVGLLCKPLVGRRRAEAREKGSVHPGTSRQLMPK